MDPAHLHLFLNHVPVIGGIGALLVLAWGVFRRSTGVTVTALVSLVLVALIAIPVFLMGGATGEQVRDLPGFSNEIAERHEEAAIAALIGLEAAAAVAAAALFAWRTTRRYPMFSAVAALIVGIAASVLLVRAAGLGGQIRHSEIRASGEASSARLK